MTTDDDIRSERALGPLDMPPARYRPLPGRPDVLVGSDGEGVWIRRKEEATPPKTVGDLIDEWEALGRELDAVLAKRGRTSTPDADDDRYGPLYDRREKIEESILNEIRELVRRRWEEDECSTGVLKHKGKLYSIEMDDELVFLLDIEESKIVEASSIEVED